MVRIDSKKIFRQAFYQLLLTKPVEQITVEMILRQSELSRATFYRHFRDKYDLMNYYYRAYLESLEYNPQTGSWQQLIADVLRFLKEHQYFFREAQKTVGQNSFLDFLLEYSISFTVKAYRMNTGREHLSYEEEAAIIYTCAGSNAVMRDWFQRGLQREPAEIAAIIYNNLPQPIKESLR